MKTTQKRTEHKNHAEKNSSLQYLNELGDKISNSNYRMPKKKIDKTGEGVREKWIGQLIVNHYFYGMAQRWLT